MKTPRWHQQSKPTASIVPIRRFVNEHIFGLKNGGYGCMFTLDGIDEEGLTDQMVADTIKRVEGALKTLPEDGRVYQYVRVRKGFELPRQVAYSNERVENTITDRTTFLDQTAEFRRVDLFWVLTVEPANKGSLNSTGFSPQQHSRNTARLISQAEKVAETLLGQLGEPLGFRLLGQDDIASFFAYLLNLEPWSLGVTLGSPERVDEQIVRSSVAWHDDHLLVGRQHVQLFSLLDTPAGSRPNLFGGLQAVNANAIFCSMWSPRSRTEVRERISEIEGFSGIFRHSLVALAANLRNLENLERSVGAMSAEKGMDNLADVLSTIDNEGQEFGLYSLIGLIHSADRREMLETMPVISKLLVDMQAPATEETQGSLSAYYAMLPGNSTGDSASNFNVRQFWLRADHNASLALVFAPDIGKLNCDDLDAEYLTIYETRAKTPYFLDPYVDGLRTNLILGAPRAGKSVNANQIILSEQKYGGYTFVIDVGGSYESTVRLFGGAVERINAQGPRINPFSLEPTDGNLSFLFEFLRLLLRKGGAAMSPEDEDAIEKSVRRIYLLSPNVRRLKHLVLPPHLQRYLIKWVEGGAFGKVFDNVEDSWRLTRISIIRF